MAAHHQWWNDVFPNLFFNDQLWAHMIRGAEWLRMVNYEARRVSFFTIQLFSRYRFQEQNICASRGPLFGRRPCEDLEISTAASPPNHVLSYSYQVNIETP